MSVTKGKVKTPSFSMDYFRFGTGEKTLVIIPGLSVKSVMDSAPAVAHEYAVMQKDFTVYVFDRREHLPPVYTVHDMARDTAEAVRTLGLEDFYLFGASQGGMIAMVLAMEHPARVRKLALGSTASELPENEVLERWIRLARERRGVELYTDFLGSIYPAELFEQYRDAVPLASEMITEEDYARFVILAEGMRGFHVTDRLPEIQCPVLALGSADDRVLGGNPTLKIAEKLRGRRDVEYYMYDGYGHAAFDTAPDYRDRLYGFFMQ